MDLSVYEDVISMAKTKNSAKKFRCFWKKQKSLRTTTKFSIPTGAVLMVLKSVYALFGRSFRKNQIKVTEQSPLIFFTMLFLIPAFLCENSPLEYFAPAIKEYILKTDYFFVENEKTARKVIKFFMSEKNRLI